MNVVIKPMLAVAFLLCSGCCFAQSVYEKQIDSLFAAYKNIPGVSVAVVKDGRVDFIKGYGLANLEYDIPVTPKTVFHIASVSKQFTAFAIYILQKQGRISLEDDIRKYIPELPDYGSPIKIKHLLGHSSGLRDQWAMLTLAGWQLEDVITTEQILKLAGRQTALNFKTGTGFGYSNTNYTLLAETIKRITGKSFADFAQENIFKPLGMTSTVAYDDFHTPLKNRAYSYEKNSSGIFIKKELHYNTIGATSIMTTTEDLAKWVINFASPIAGDAELIKEFNKISLLDNGQPVVWGASPSDTTFHAKGQLHYKYRGLPVISHGGHDAGFRAVVMRFPEHNLAIITLSNNEHYEMLGKVKPVADLYLKDKMMAAAPNSPVNTTATYLQEPFNNELSDFEGTYESDELLTQYSITVKADKLVMTHIRLPDMDLEATGTDSFSGTNTFGFTIIFIRNGKNVTGYEISNFGAKKVKFMKK